jgi:hypothetical protein
MFTTPPTHRVIVVKIVVIVLVWHAAVIVPQQILGTLVHGDAGGCSDCAGDKRVAHSVRALCTANARARRVRVTVCECTCTRAHVHLRMIGGRRLRMVLWWRCLWAHCLRRRLCMLWWRGVGAGVWCWITMRSGTATTTTTTAADGGASTSPASVIMCCAHSALQLTQFGHCLHHDHHHRRLRRHGRQ